VQRNLREREEGIRIKHSASGNSVNAYAKAPPAVESLWEETTIDGAAHLKVYPERR
jgi:hypothetical protein